MNESVAPARVLNPEMRPAFADVHFLLLRPVAPHEAAEAKLADGTKIALPWIYSPTGELIDWSGFLIDFPPQAVRMIWQGPHPLRVGRMVNGYGKAFPVPANVAITPGNPIVLPHVGPGKVTGTGLLLREGRVIRDNGATPEQFSADRAFEERWLVETKELVRAAIKAGATEVEILDGLTQRSFRGASGIELLKVIRAGN